MRTMILAGLASLALLASLATPAAEEPVPAPLRDWQGWVLHGQEFRLCPFAAGDDQRPGRPIDERYYRCLWPERLTLAVDSRGGTFSQRWQVSAESWVALPGDAEHWPRDVKLNGAPAAVVARGEQPSLRLAPGAYTVSG